VTTGEGTGQAALHRPHAWARGPARAHAHANACATTAQQPVRCAWARMDERCHYRLRVEGQRLQCLQVGNVSASDSRDKLRCVRRMKYGARTHTVRASVLRVSATYTLLRMYVDGFSKPKL
jgi:hypothetical protein